MNSEYKPAGYNSVSPYFVVAGAQKLINLLKDIFEAEELRRYNLPDGNIMHAEVRIDDSVLMLGDASAQFPANKLLTHIYVKDVDQVFEKAMAAGCQPLEEPKERANDPDRRGAFTDFAGNIWSVATQLPRNKRV